MRRVLFATYPVANCGVHQYAQNLFAALSGSREFEFVYKGVADLQELDQLVRAAHCDAIMVNYHPQTLPFLPVNGQPRYAIPCIAVMHEMTPLEADRMPDGFFQAYVMGDPTLESSNSRVYTTGRVIPPFQNPYRLPEVPTIGSFGFAVGSKGFQRVVDAVQEEFDEAVVRINIPANGIIDPKGDLARGIVERCRARIWKPGIQLVASHEFFDSDQVLDFLAANTLNAFLYDYLPRAGISSAADQALTVRRPVAVTRSIMFRHLFSLRPAITIENNSLKNIIENGIGPYRHLLDAWAPERMRTRYEEILDDVLRRRGHAGITMQASAHSEVPGQNKRMMERILASRLWQDSRRRVAHYLWRPSRDLAKALSVRTGIAIGRIKPRTRYNRILDDTARIEYAEVIARIAAIAPDVVVKKIPRANVQQAFIFDAVEQFARCFSNPRILAVGSFEDSAAIALKRLGFEIQEVDPAVNGVDLNGYTNLPTTKPASYDIIFATSVLEHVKDDAKFLSQIASLLAPGGIGLLTCDFKPDYKLGDPVIDTDWRFYSKQDLSTRVLDSLPGCKLVDTADWNCVKPDFELGGFRYAFATLAFRKADSPHLDVDWASLTPSEQERFYCENGFLVIPGALSGEEVRAALDDIKQHLLKGTTENVWDAPFTRKLVVNARLLSALRAVFGKEIRFFKAAYVESPPDDLRAHPKQRKALHVDYGIGEPDGDYRNSAAVWVNVATYLTDLSVEHSPLWVVPGTNRVYGVIPATDMERFSDRAKMVLARAGDMVLFNCNTVHAASHNFSAEPRHALFYSYRPAWAKPVGPVTEWPEEFINSFPEEHRALFTGLNRGI